MKQLVLVLCSCLVACLAASGQNLVINGGFETIDPNVTPTPINDWAIEYAPPWKSLYGTCDIGHPNAPFNMGMIPNSGQGCMRVAHRSEYALGRTMALTAGTTYEVSFAAKRDNSCQVYDRTIGLQITATDPSQSPFNPDDDFRPQVEIAISSGTYATGTYCFTAETSGVHYIIIGGTCEDIPGENNALCYAVDDVAVFEKTDLSDMPTASVTSAQTTYCLSDNILLDGSASSNETSHLWKIHRIVGGEVRPCELYNSGWTNGQAGTLNVPDAFQQAQHAPNGNSCYRAYLYVDNGCRAIDYFDFCYTEPTVNFLHDGQPVCEGGLVDLNVTGDNGWTYTWSDANGQIASGVGLKTMQVTPETGNENYTVTVTTPEGCTLTRTYGFTVHTDNNVAPWMNGINGTGEYTYYVTAGDVASFTSTVLNDNSNEQLVYTLTDNIPTAIVHNITLPPTGQNGGALNFSMTTHPFGTLPGSYTFTLMADDQNACSPGISSFTFTIVVICDQCPVCINYENRTPEGIRLPAETKAGQCISAGLSQPVKTGTAGVRFQAGQFILLGQNFEAGPGFEALIEPTTCVTDCEDCCRNWTGFTYDELPNPFYINFHDDDPTNDFIQVTDTYHPFCAFNAFGYEFNIMDRQGGNPINTNGTRALTTNYCCAFRSPAPENPIPQSSIWWDGHRNNLFGNPVQASDGVYFYTLKLYGCGGQVEEKHGFITVGGIPPGMATAPDDLNATEGYASLSEQERALLEQATVERERLEQNVALSPNPTTGTVHITGVETDDLAYQLFDDKGNMLSRKEPAPNGTFSMEKYTAGTYYVWIFTRNTYVTKKLIKI